MAPARAAPFPPRWAAERSGPFRPVPAQHHPPPPGTWSSWPGPPPPVGACPWRAPARAPEPAPIAAPHTTGPAVAPIQLVSMQAVTNGPSCNDHASEMADRKRTQRETVRMSERLCRSRAPAVPHERDQHDAGESQTRIDHSVSCPRRLPILRRAPQLPWTRQHAYEPDRYPATSGQPISEGGSSHDP